MSGAVSPFERADLGPWLTDPDKIAQWDTLIVTKLDRLSRSLIDFAGLLKWCQEHGKIIVSVSESLDFGTAAGRLMAQILMMFAEFERERMSQRAAVKIRSNGHYGGGSTPYGYRTIKVNSHHELEPDPAQVAVVEQIAADVIAGKSLNSIAQALNASGRPAAQGGRWHGGTLGIMMRNPALKGFVMHDGQPVRGEDGLPVRRAAVLDDATWDAVQAKLGAVRKVSRQDGSPYLGVIVCGACGAQLYLSQWMSAGQRRAYYRHAGNGCPVKNISAAKLEAIMDLRIKQELGATRVLEPVEHPAEDHTAELAQVEQAIADIENLVTSGAMPPASAARMLGTLEGKRATLAALPQREAWTEYLDGGSFADRWTDLEDDADRGALLRQMGVKIAASMEGRKVTAAVAAGQPAGVA